MTNVYILTCEVEYEGASYMGVFSSRKVAKKYLVDVRAQDKERLFTLDEWYLHPDRVTEEAQEMYHSTGDEWEPRKGWLPAGLTYVIRKEVVDGKADTLSTG